VSELAILWLKSCSYNVDLQNSSADTGDVYEEGSFLLSYRRDNFVFVRDWNMKERFLAQEQGRLDRHDRESSVERNELILGLNDLNCLLMASRRIRAVVVGQTRVFQSFFSSRSRRLLVLASQRSIKVSSRIRVIIKAFVEGGGVSWTIKTIAADLRLGSRQRARMTIEILAIAQGPMP
jgi:hypothetical protein